MTLVVVPVRYPLSEHSRATVKRALDLAREENAELTVLHVNLYQSDQRITRTELKRAVEREFGRLDFARYVVRPGFLVEETILDEVAEEGADFVVIGQKQASRWRSMVRRLVDDPDVEDFLRRELECKVITASP
ncbi:MAG: nucleotide-binding universal stress UspA family protein [Natronomonas sp.]|jgi:nucleotide-binding universal stress UspA family protein